MDGDFFQLLRRIQKEERNKATLARVEKDFYKKLYSYIRGLERSVASDPFGNDQLLLTNAQRIATEICRTRETKISKAANNNIHRSFHLFKKENPQFDLLDTTPLNLTDEEETLYFSLIDVLKNHRYRISLDKFGEENSSIVGNIDDEEDFNDDNEFEAATLSQAHVNPGVVSEEEFFKEDGSDEKDISESVSGEDIPESVSGGESESISSMSQNEEISPKYIADENDEVLNRLNQIKNSTVVEDEKYEPIEKQINNQVNVHPTASLTNNMQIKEAESQEKDENTVKDDNGSFEDESESQVEEESKNSSIKSFENKLQSDDISEANSVESFENKLQSDDVSKTNSVKSFDNKPQAKEERPKRSSSTLDFDSIFADPDSQFADIDQFEQNYEDDFASISNFAAPSAEDLNFSIKSAKPKSSIKGIKEELQSVKSKRAINSLATKEELENTAVVILKDIKEFVAVDEKVYGPFSANDMVILPNINAQILIDNDKAGLVNI